MCAWVSFLPVSRHSRAQAGFFLFQVVLCVFVSLFFSRLRGQRVPKVELFPQQKDKHLPILGGPGTVSGTIFRENPILYLGGTPCL